ncbi:tetratricopeptide repeat protein [bacterium]|nr:tetratricopeptide repeat protein [bacterium]
MESIDVRVLIQKAQTFYQQGRWSLAINEYLKIVAIDPYNIPALTTLGDIYSRQGDLKQAYSMYQKVAKYYIEKSEFTKAIGTYKKITRLDDKNGKAFYEMGKLYENEGMNEDALNSYVGATELLNAFDDEIVRDIYSRMARLDPDNIDLHLSLAKKFIDAGNKNEAKDEIITVIRGYLKAGQFDKAEEQIILLSSIVSEEHVNYAKALIAQSKEDYTTSETLLKKVIGANPYFVDAYYELGQTRLKAGKLQQAKLAFQHCLKYKPDFIPVLEYFGDNNQEEGRNELAVNKYQEAVKYALDKSQFNEAKRILKKIIAIAPNNLPAIEKLRTLGVDVKGGIITPATEINDKETLTEAVKTTPGEVKLPTNIMEIPSVSIDFQTKRKLADLLDEANTFNNTGIYDKATENFKKVLEIDPNNESALKTLADNAMLNGDNDNATKYYKTLIKIYYNHADYDTAINAYERAKSLKNDPELGRFKEEIDKKKALLEQVEDSIERENEPKPQENIPTPNLDTAPIQEEPKNISPSADNKENLVTTVNKNEVIQGDFNDAVDNFQDKVDEVIGDDIKAHFDMGMAFYSMQLFSKAIVEFQKVIQDPTSDVYLPSVEQIAQCFLDQGFYEATINWATKGLEGIGSDQNTGLKFKFLLGQALEQMGEKQKAFQVYLEVYEINARFQSVNKIISKLKKELNIQKQKTVAEEVNSQESIQDLLSAADNNGGTGALPDKKPPIPEKKKEDKKNDGEPPKQNPKISFL